MIPNAQVLEPGLTTLAVDCRQVMPPRFAVLQQEWRAGGLGHANRRNPIATHGVDRNP